MNQDVILQVKHLQTKFRVGRKIVNAVNDVSFELKKGRTLGIVGESGCGKSASAHSIMQLLPRSGNITGGSVIYHGPKGEIRLEQLKRNGKMMRSLRGKEISMIFQDPMSSLNPVYTVGRQMEENLIRHEKLTKGERKKRIVAMLEELGIPDAERRCGEYPHQFSGGMKQRVMIGIAMICNPRIMIADEPTTALDVTIQAQILELMKDMQRKHGTSIVLITHNMGIVAEACEEVAVMYLGKVVEYGTLEPIFENPLHPYTKALMRSVPVIGMDRDRELMTIPGATPDASTVFRHCEFVERCGSACGRCWQEMPEVICMADGHQVRCLRYKES